MNSMYSILQKRLANLIAFSSLAALPVFSAAGASMVTNWVAYNDHNRGTGTVATVTAYSLTQSGNVGQPVGGTLTNFNTGEGLAARMDVASIGYINGTTGDSTAPTGGTPADQIFGGKLTWTSSALYFAPSPYTARVTITFTNLTPGARYNFKGVSVRGKSYPGRWSLATLEGVSSATATHITGSGTPGIITNGWSPYGDNLVANMQAAWNAYNIGGDVIAWDNIVPVNNSFSVTVSNLMIVVGSSAAVPGGTMENTYCYAFSGISLTELVEMTPVEITRQPTATNVEAYAAWSLSVAATGPMATYQWYKGALGAGTLVEGATAPTLSRSSATLEDAGTYYVVIANELNSVTSQVAQVSVFVNPIQITQQPTNQLTALQLRPFSLRVAVSGTMPFYQWFKDGQPLQDATNSVYSVTSASAADGGSYQVIITNLLYSATSQVSQVNFTTDIDPPALVRVTPNGTLNQVMVEFNEAVLPSFAVQTSIYDLQDENNNSLGVSQVIMGSERTVVLNTDTLMPGRGYTLKVLMICDLVENYTYDLSGSFTAWVPNKSGGVIFDVYATGTGTAISNLTASAIFPNAPTMSLVLTNFCTTNVWPDAENGLAYRNNYGGRLRGFFIPPISGDWRLFLSTDDNGQLWFNTNGPSADGKMLVAYETNYNTTFQEPPAIQTTQPYRLTAGQPYYVEVLYKEQTGGDYGRVGARREGDSTALTNLMPIIEVGYPYLPAGLFGVCSFLEQPASPTVESPGGFTISVTGTNSINAPFNYQWQTNDGSGNFINVAGETLRTLSRTNLMVDQNGMQFRCVIAAGDAGATSQVATITVLPDSTGPMLLGATRYVNQTNILLTFSEILDAAKVPNATFQVCDAFTPAACLQVLTATLTNNDMAILLETAAPDPAGIYVVTVVGLTDTNNNAVQPPASVPVGVMLSFQQGVNGYTGTVDTYVRSDNATTTYNTANTVLVDNLSPLAQGLLRFDNIIGTSGGQIPPGSAIASAKLYLQTTNWGNDIRVHRMLVPWVATNTWNTVGTPNDGVNTNAGGDAVTAPDFIFQTVAVGTTVELNVQAQVAYWSTNDSNYGWALINTSDDGYQFNSSEAADPVSRPRLVVTYTPSTTASPVQIVTQPAASQTVNEGQNASFSVGVIGPRPEFQWFKDGIAIPGATNMSYSLSAVVETNAGRYYCVITNLAPSVTNTIDSILVVNADTNRPVLASALALGNPAQIRLVFSKLMSPTSVGDIANYVVAPAYGGANLTIVSAELQTNGTTVILTTSARDPFSYYELTVQNVTDAAYRHNVITNNPTKLLLNSQISLIAADAQWRFNESGLDLGTEWATSAYDDSGWSNGLALFVAKNGTPGNADLPIQTLMATSNSAPGHLTNTVTIYFRQHFTLPTLAQLANLRQYSVQVHPILDDGAVFHLNGQEGRRVGMTNQGAITYSTFANRTQGNDYRYEGPYDLPTTNLNFGGDNVLAVDVHQVSAGSSDIAFATELLINIPAPVMRLEPALVNGTTMQLNWPPVTGYVLYEADHVEGPYTPVAGNPNGAYSVPTAQSAGKFYQLRRQ